jgi:hypothetical protein
MFSTEAYGTNRPQQRMASKPLHAGIVCSYPSAQDIDYLIFLTNDEMSRVMITDMR